MARKINSIILFTVLMVFILSAVYAQETVRLTNGDWAPYMGENLKYNGVVSRIVKEAFESQGIEVTYGFFPWKRSFDSALSGEWDGSIAWSPAKVPNQEMYISDPVVEVKKVFFYLKGTKFSWNTITDLKNYTIGIEAGNSYGTDFDAAAKNKTITVEEAPDAASNFKKLFAKRIDVFVGATEVAFDYINTLSKNEQAQITYDPKPVQVTPLVMLISKKIPDSRAKMLISKFNAGLKELKKNGKYNQYMQESQAGKYK